LAFWFFVLFLFLVLAFWFLVFGFLVSGSRVWLSGVLLFSKKKENEFKKEAVALGFRRLLRKGMIKK